MPYFSFSLNKSLINQLNIDDLQDTVLLENITYFSKNTKLWKQLNKTLKKDKSCKIKFEERKKIKLLNKKILFLLPPSIGLGDAVEYALAIKAIILSNIFLEVGVAFIGRYKKIYLNYFNISNVYEQVISQKELLKYDTLFHVSLELDCLKHQKYVRSDIEKNFTNYFNIKNFRKPIVKNKNKINTITVFPVSNSPIRSMPIDIIEQLILSFHDNYKLIFVLDHKSEISNFIEQKISFSKCYKLHPDNLDELTKIIENCQFGIFMDSGPLHIAKILNKAGILIETTVNSGLLLNDFCTIKAIKNNYESLNCKSPCGLTNIFNFKNNIGCYQSLKISKNEIFNISQNSMQRGSLKNCYTKFMLEPVGCLKNINSEKLIKYINEYIELN